jgi:hypothetical protein
MTATTVPYIFANDTGNIPLSQLDVNFANVKAFANTAGYVTESTQANITTVGTLANLSVTGNITSGNILTGGAIVFTGGSRLRPLGANLDIFAGTGSYVNLITSDESSSVGVDGGGGYITTAGGTWDFDTTGNLTAPGNISATGNITSGNVNTSGQVSSTGNVTGANLVTTGISSRYIDVSIPVYANITASGTYSLSTTNSINILIANNTGYTATLNMPATPSDGQVCNFAIHGNTVTLSVGTGTVLPTFTGSATVGTGYRYVYRNSNSTWYKIG